jgi:hypothetical protein
MKPEVVITNNPKFGARFPFRVYLVRNGGRDGAELLAKCVDRAMAMAARDAFERSLAEHGEGE